MSTILDIRTLEAVDSYQVVAAIDPEEGQEAVVAYWIHQHCLDVVDTVKHYRQPVRLETVEKPYLRIGQIAAAGMVQQTEGSQKEDRQC